MTMMPLLKCGPLESTMTFNRLAQFAAVVSVTVFVSAAAMPALAGNCGVGVGNGNATCKSDGGTASGLVAPLPALGTGLPGLIVLVGGLVAFARRRHQAIK
jgi:hypothetical protein